MPPLPGGGRQAASPPGIRPMRNTQHRPSTAICITRLWLGARPPVVTRPKRIPTGRRTTTTRAPGSWRIAVVTNRAVPARIRRALNVESGLNDGIATPFVTLFIAVVAAEEDLGDHAWALEALKQIGLAIIAAVVVGYVGGKLLSLATNHGWTSAVSQQIAVLAL